MPEISENLVSFFILPYRCVSFPLFMISCFLFYFSVISS